MPQPTDGRTARRPRLRAARSGWEPWVGRLEEARALWRNRTVALALLDHLHVATSQYGEDVVFDRLFHPGPHGCYVDVGSHHPTIGSNTYKLYVRGWSGLTVDPNPEFAELTRRSRPRDVHLVEGVSDRRGELTYHEFDVDKLNTLVERRVEELVAAGHPVRATRRVVCRPLTEMVEEHLGGRHIDLLSVDCEGLDLDVLRSLDFEAHRPTVMIVEDFDSLRNLQGRRAPSALAAYVRDLGYTPVAQAAWSQILVTNDWEEQFARSDAYSVDRVYGYMPGATVV